MARFPRTCGCFRVKCLEAATLPVPGKAHVLNGAWAQPECFLTSWRLLPSERESLTGLPVLRQVVKKAEPVRRDAKGTAVKWEGCDFITTSPPEEGHVRGEQGVRSFCCPIRQKSAARYVLTPRPVTSDSFVRTRRPLAQGSHPSAVQVGTRGMLGVSPGERRVWR